MAQMKKTAAKGTAKKMATKPSTVQQIAKRFGVTAREARDIATAVGTLGKAALSPSGTFGGQTKKVPSIVRSGLDVAKQIGETATAARTGKSGKSANKLKTMARATSGLPADVEYMSGKKRKQGSKK